VEKEVRLVVVASVYCLAFPNYLWSMVSACYVVVFNDVMIQWYTVCCVCCVFGILCNVVSGWQGTMLVHNEERNDCKIHHFYEMNDQRIAILLCVARRN
jgi:hypothetical protein